MKLQEIENILGIADSTLSDWDRNPQRKKLMKLLRVLSKKEVLSLLESEEFTPKYSPRTRKIKLHKEWFQKDLLYSREDNSLIEIDNLIAVYLKQPNQADINTLLYLFGSTRLKRVLKKIEDTLDLVDYNEAKEQIEYAISKKRYKKEHPLPPVEKILENPKERYIEMLQEKYSKKRIIAMAEANNISYNAMFKIKKIVGEQ